MHVYQVLTVDERSYDWWVVVTYLDSTEALETARRMGGEWIIKKYPIGGVSPGVTILDDFSFKREEQVPVYAMHWDRMDNRHPVASDYPQP